ncbi:MAG: acetyl-CoA carboxylase carboxyltransferase subunit alpha [Alphaproteobacteria bacterium]|nr:acetyl-CoA carboxylase carboxyltransferase subunit alpha [Alphaproteobacteria bacterium]
MRTYLDFEKPIAEIEGKIADLQDVADDGETDGVRQEIEVLEGKAKSSLEDIYKKLTPWQKTQVARHGERPHCSDYIAQLITEFSPLSGDRAYADDAAIVGGPGRFRGEAVMIIGHEKGSDTESRLKHNFGMARPEGYRKAIRLMEMADKFGLPILTFVDTPGAYPGVGAEERGQAEAIARSTDCCLSLRVPVIATITGEGGSGGAIAIATANTAIMMEHSIYSVISPEGAASILWRDSARAEDAATAMKITAQDLKKLGVIDAIVAEPVGGAHRNPEAAIEAVGDVIAGALDELSELKPNEVRQARRDKFIKLGSAL